VADVYDLIRQAILTKAQVFATYGGYPREMCPHVIGTKWGRVNALFYQFAGSSSTGIGPAGSPDNWRCVHIDQLEDVALQEGPWHTAPNHTRPQTCVDEVDVEVSFFF